MTHAFTLNYGMAPVSTGTNAVETGFLSALDNVTDDDVDMTIDFGFTKGVGVGNLVFRDTDANGLYNAGDSGVAGVTVQLFRSTDSPLTGTPVASTTTAATGSGTNAGSFAFVGSDAGQLLLACWA